MFLHKHFQPFGFFDCVNFASNIQLTPLTVLDHKTVEK